MSTIFSLDIILEYFRLPAVLLSCKKYFEKYHMYFKNVWEVTKLVNVLICNNPWTGVSRSTSAFSIAGYIKCYTPFMCNMYGFLPTQSLWLSTPNIFDDIAKNVWSGEKQISMDRTTSWPVLYVENDEVKYGFVPKNKDKDVTIFNLLPHNKAYQTLSIESLNRLNRTIKPYGITKEFIKELFKIKGWPWVKDPDMVYQYIGFKKLQPCHFDDPSFWGDKEPLCPSEALPFLVADIRPRFWAELDVMDFDYKILLDSSIIYNVWKYGQAHVGLIFFYNQMITNTSIYILPKHIDWDNIKVPCYFKNGTLVEGKLDDVLRTHG